VAGPLRRDHRARRRAGERPRAQHQLPQHDAERVQVGPRIDAPRPRLGGGVADRAARGGAAGVGQRRRQPEVGEPRSAARRVQERGAVDEDVRRLEVGVDHAGAVDRGQRLEHATQERPHPLRGHRAHRGGEGRAG
jgi:hypothetical protein